jgi:hypothetical protein
MAMAQSRNQKMKRSTLETRRQAVSAIICDYPGGRDCAAPRLGLNLKQFDNHAYQNAGSRPLSDEQLHLLEQDAGTHHLPDYVCGLYGGVFVPLADPESVDNIDLYSRALDASAKRGMVDSIIEMALKDGVISTIEIRQILSAHRAYVAARHAEVAAVIILHQE